MDLRRVSNGLQIDPEYENLKGEKLGSGGQGIVSKVRRVSDGEILACKTVHCAEDVLKLINARKEVATWRAVGREKYIAEYCDSAWIESTMQLKLYMIWYKGGDLQTVIHRADLECTYVHPIIATACAVQISQGVRTCHAREIIHRDLKPGNVVLSASFECNDLLWKVTNQDDSLSSEEFQEVKAFVRDNLSDSPWCHITDFGFSKFSSHIVSGGTIMSSTAGYTPHYLAPEAEGSYGRFSAKSDIYALGVLLYYLCERRYPYPNRERRYNYQSISSIYPQRLRTLIDQCLKDDPNCRPEINEFISEAENLHKNYRGQFIMVASRQKLMSSKSTGIGSWIPVIANPSRYVTTSWSSSELMIRPKSIAVARMRASITPEYQTQLDQALFQACAEGDFEAAVKMMQKGASPAATDSYGDNALHTTAMFGYLKIAQAIVQYGIDINSAGRGGYTALHWAAKGAHNEVILYLLNKGAHINSADTAGQTPIFRALLEGHYATLVMLVHGHPKMNLNRQDKTGSTVLHYAVEENNKNFFIMTYYLLNQGADSGIPDRNNYTPLHRAAASNCPAQIRYLVQQGADIEHRGGIFGTTPLHKACWEKSSEAADALIQLGANITAVSEYKANLPIHIVARNGCTEIGEQLLDRDKDLQLSREIDGWTPLHIAARWNSVAFAQMLLDRGANPHVLNKNGKKPRQLTLPIVHWKIRDLLETAEKASKQIFQLIPK